MAQNKPSLTALLVRTSSVTGISIGDIAGRGRKREIVDARQVFCCAAYYCGHNYENIGESIGRDHSSIIHQCNERPLPEASIAKIRMVRGSKEEDNVAALAFALYKNPSDDDVKQKLKDLL